MIIITGAAGFIGQALQTQIDQSLGLDRAADERRPDNLVFDLTATTQASALSQLFLPHSPTAIIHLAGMTPWSGNPDFSLDLKMAETLTKVCNQLKIPKLLFMSGWVVYAPDASVPIQEDAALAPNTDYGKSKLAVEQYLAAHLTDTTLINMRAASIYGPGQLSSGLIPNLVGDALSKHILTLGGKQTKRDYLYINDAVTAIQQLATGDISENTNINLGGGQSYSVQTVAETIREICGDVEINYAPDLTESEPLDNCLSIEKAQHLGLLTVPTILEEGLRAYIEWRQHAAHF